MDGQLASCDADTGQLRHPRLDADANDHRYRHVATLAELRQHPDRTYLLFTVTIRMTFDVFRLFDQLYDRRRTYCTVLHCNLSKQIL